MPAFGEQQENRDKEALAFERIYSEIEWTIEKKDKKATVTIDFGDNIDCLRKQFIKSDVW